MRPCREDEVERRLWMVCGTMPMTVAWDWVVLGGCGGIRERSGAILIIWLVQID